MLSDTDTCGICMHSKSGCYSINVLLLHYIVSCYTMLSGLLPYIYEPVVLCTQSF